MGLRKFTLDPVVVIFFKICQKITSGGLIQDFEKLALDPVVFWKRKKILLKKITSMEYK